MIFIGLNPNAIVDLYGLLQRQGYVKHRAPVAGLKLR